MRRFPILLAILLALSAPVVLGQEEEEESEQDRGIVDVDTCGTLAGKLVTYMARTELSWSGHPGHEAIDIHHSIAMGRDSERSVLLTWTSEAHPSDIKPFKVKANKKDLKIYTKDENRLVAHFIQADNWILLMPVYRKLLFAPAFRKRIEKSFETAIIHLDALLNSPVDDTSNRYGKKLMDSAIDLKRASQPAVLAEARKIDKLLAARMRT